ncbi:MAG TPA: cyclodeaminase/cyclohydrolase family protein [Gemmatimonadales bacterium]|jgi:formiminotetrahydrofolate cyclodeaminase|nr:cyclodeaminase/cyclohydrolase family protein [Gemmatimonadales bacterium]
MIGANDPIAAWADALAAPTATPAGGSAAAIAAGLAASLVAMVGSLTAGRESYAEVQGEAAAAAARAEPLRRRLLELAAEDVEAFGEVMDALALPRGSEAEIARRNAARAGALKDAAGVQYELLLMAGEVADLAEALTQRGLRSAMGDAASAAFLAAASCRSAYWAIRSNLRRMYDDPEAERLIEQALERLELVEATEARVLRRLTEQV